MIKNIIQLQLLCQVKNELATCHRNQFRTRYHNFEYKRCRPIRCLRLRPGRINSSPSNTTFHDPASSKILNSTLYTGTLRSSSGSNGPGMITRYGMKKINAPSPLISQRSLMLWFSWKKCVSFNRRLPF